tara:strand:- start:269 stop:2314 length:2046 start_codon:yes stop_codon:yes gene_type:complete
MAEGDVVETSADKQTNKNIGHVVLKQNITINPGKRLPIFDNGTSLAYEAKNKNGEVSIAIICDPKNVARHTQIITYNSLIDTSLFHMIDHGVVFWPLDNEERLVFIYRCLCDAPIGQDLEASKAKWRTADIQNVFIKPMVRAMEEMHTHNFVHGSIRPSNIFFSSARPKEAVVLGDCLSVQSGGTQPAIYEPIDRAMAHPMARGDGAPAHDIYAFGVTLVMLLRSNSNFAKITDEEITRQKVEKGSYVALVGHERFHSNFLTLLRGVLHDDESQRWDIEEINSWVDGGRLSPPQLKSRKKATRPFQFAGKSYYHATSLAYDLHVSLEEVAAIVKDDQLGQWLEKSLGSKDIYEKYCEALVRCEKRAKNDIDFLMSNIRMTLAPDFPVYYKGLTFCPEGLGAYIASQMYQEKSIEIPIEILTNTLALFALRQTKTPRITTTQNIKSLDIARIETPQKRLGSGIEKSMYSLCPDSICLSPKFKGRIVKTKKDMMRCFENLSAKGNAISLFLDNHIVSYLYVVDSSVVDRAVYDVASDDKDEQIFGNLHCLANIQKANGQLYPAIAKVFMGSIDGLIKRFNNKSLRERISKSVAKASEKGDLYDMYEILSNPNVLARDSKAFAIVKREYAALEKEKHSLKAQMANKKTFGVKRGRDTAAVFAWIIATIVSVMFVVGFLGGRVLF